MAGIKRGDLIEFTDGPHQNYPPADASLVRYGVAIEDERDALGYLRVQLADGSIVDARHVHSYAWAGWIPDGLEPIWEALTMPQYEHRSQHEDDGGDY